MVEIALFAGIISNLIFGIGLVGRLNLLQRYSFLIFIVFLGFIIFLIFKKKKAIFEEVKKILKEKNNRLILLLLAVLSLVNLIGALGPEIVFDALWYHLTIPKIYLQNNRIFFIPGGLYHYSAMPKLTEMLYLFSLIFYPSGQLAKVIHYSFGILSAIALYNLSRRYLKPKYGLLAVLIFYSSLIIGWESATAYVDLTKTFFEILSIDFFLKWIERKKDIYLIESAVMTGLAISSKILAMGNIFIFLIVIALSNYNFQKKTVFVIKYLFISLTVVFPWLLFSFIFTKNPIYPVFSGILDKTHTFFLPGILTTIREFLKLFFYESHPINPIILIFFPIIFLKRKQIMAKSAPFFWLVILFFSYWLLIPKTGGARFFIFCLSLFSLCTSILIEKQTKRFQKMAILSIIAVSIFNMTFRFFANQKYLKVIFKKESTVEFLSKNLNFEFNDFLDKDNEIKKIVKNDNVLIIGSHNLFYADFNFTHESYANPEMYFRYILTQNKNLNDKYFKARKIYSDNLTNVNLYLYNGGIK